MFSHLQSTAIWPTFCEPVKRIELRFMETQLCEREDGELCEMKTWKLGRWRYPGGYEFLPTKSAFSATVISVGTWEASSSWQVTVTPRAVQPGHKPGPTSLGRRYRPMTFLQRAAVRGIYSNPIGCTWVPWTSVTQTRLFGPAVYPSLLVRRCGGGWCHATICETRLTFIFPATRVTLSVYDILMTTPVPNTELRNVLSVPQ